MPYLDWLNKVPPDFDLARIHGEASMVKDVSNLQRNTQDLENKDYYCQCWHMPTFKAAPKYSKCVDIMKLGELGSGFPLYFHSKIFTGVIYFRYE